MTLVTFELYLSYALQGVMATGAVANLIQRQWTASGLTCGALVLTCVPLVLRQFFGVRTPPPFSLFLVLFVFGSLFLGEAQGLYRQFWWWDMALHFISGVLLSVVGLLLAHLLNGATEIRNRMRPGFVAFSLLCLLWLSARSGRFWSLYWISSSPWICRQKKWVSPPHYRIP